MIVTLYHGSENIIKSPQFGFGKTTNDYGCGFYCTKNKELAKEWACQNNHNGFVNCYMLNTSKLSILNLNSKEHNILEWITLLLKNRSFLGNVNSDVQKNFLLDNFVIDTVKYDIIKGYRADDSYFAFARDFVTNQISVQQLEKAMRFGKLGTQIMIKSQSAFNEIKFQKANAVDRTTYFMRFSQRDTAARLGYRKMRTQTGIKGLYIIDIMRDYALFEKYLRQKNERYNEREQLL